METLPSAEMQLVHDKELEEDCRPIPTAKYLGTFFSARGQVRADLFDDGEDVIAYISFPTGLDADERRGSICGDTRGIRGESWLR